MLGVQQQHTRSTIVGSQLSSHSKTCSRCPRWSQSRPSVPSQRSQQRRRHRAPVWGGGGGARGEEGVEQQEQGRSRSQEGWRSGRCGSTMWRVTESECSLSHSPLSPGQQTQCMRWPQANGTTPSTTALLTYLGHLVLPVVVLVASCGGKGKRQRQHKACIWSDNR